MRKRFWLIFTLLLMLSFGVHAEVLYTQSFDGEGLPEDFRPIEGTWVVEDGRIIGNSLSGSVQGRVIFGPELENFVYSVDVTFLSAVNDSRWFSIFFRATPNGMAPYHMFTVRHNARLSNGTELAFRNPAGNWDVRRTNNYKEKFEIGKTYRLKVAVTDNYYFYFINDELMFVAYERGYRDNGVFGLHVNGCKVAFDNIVIESYNSADYKEFEEIAVQEVSPILPRVVAHRGNSSVAPENTLAAIQSAIDVGADMVEIDVYATKDGEIVLLHDGTLDRTTNGRGSVQNFTLAQLKELDAGSWKNARYAGEKIPTLQEALLLAKDQIRVVIELKTVGQELKVRDIVEELGMKGQVAVISFHTAAIRTFRQIASDIPAAILIGSANSYADIERIAKSANTNILDLAHSLVDKESAVYFIERGYSIWAWTVNNEAIMERMAECGVTVLTTDVPVTALKTLRTVKD
ncbi:MAG: glycerophosphodiester phosphodiesterase family protein [Firmicutes bacterium]|nr:glycerophosphodiester phosphodiesterase family protein [Bacillota bacterium]MDD4694393.1 glycerophosphodiester phosphodiesterase family protein [Bacillota bacterium]